MTARRFAAAALIAAAGIALAGGATAAAESFPRVAVEQDGTAHFSWRHDHPDEYRTSMWERERSPAGVYGAPRWISPGTGFWAYGGDVHLDPEGAATYVWDRGSAPWVVYARRKSPDGALGPLQTVSPADSSQPVAAVDARGAAIFAWTHIEDDGKAAVVQARRRYPNGGLGPIRTLSERGRLSIAPEVAVDAAGNALVVWLARDELDGPSDLAARRIAADGTLSPIRPLTERGSSVQSQRVAFDGDGNALIAWLRVEGRRYVPELARRSANGYYSATQRLWTSPLSADDLRLAVNEDGAAAVTWSSFTYETKNVVRGRFRRPDGTLGTVMTLSEPASSNSFHPQVALDPRGATTFTWTSLDGDGYEIQTRRRSPLGAVGPIRTVSGPGAYDAQESRVATDGAGGAMVVWEEGAIRASRLTAGGTPGRVETVSAE